MVQSQEQLDLISLWDSAGLKCYDEALLPKVHQVEPKRIQLEGKTEAWDECVHVYVCENAGRNIGPVNSITADYHNYVHLHSLSARGKDSVHLESATFENISMKLKVPGVFWLTIVLGSDCFTSYSFLPPSNYWLLSDIRAPFALIKRTSLQNS